MSCILQQKCPRFTTVFHLKDSFSSIRRGTNQFIYILSGLLIYPNPPYLTSTRGSISSSRLARMSQSRRSSSRMATMRRTVSAPNALASSSWYSSTTKSLRRMAGLREGGKWFVRPRDDASTAECGVKHQMGGGGGGGGELG